MSGWIVLARGWRDDEVFDECGPLSEREAWVWLLEKAAWKKCHRRNAKGERITVERGQFHTSLRNLSTAFGWSKNKVARYLDKLADYGLIGTVAGQSGCMITICNYSKYQDQRDSLSAENGTVAGQSRDTQEQRKQRKQENNILLFPIPHGVSDAVWIDFQKLRKAKKAPISETAIEAIEREAIKAGFTLNEALTECVARGWQGFKAEWVLRESKQGQWETAIC